MCFKAPWSATLLQGDRAVGVWRYEEASDSWTVVREPFNTTNMQPYPRTISARSATDAWIGFWGPPEVPGSGRVVRFNGTGWQQVRWGAPGDRVEELQAVPYSGAGRVWARVVNGAQSQLWLHNSQAWLLKVRGSPKAP